MAYITLTTRACVVLSVILETLPEMPSAEEPQIVQVKCVHIQNARVHTSLRFFLVSLVSM